MPRQLSLHAPKFDDFGLHAHDCECARCSAGFRPSQSERWAARMAYERVKHAGKAAADLDAKGARKAEVSARTNARLERDAEEVSKRLREEQALRARVRPLTEEEIRELREENGLRPPRKKGG